MDNAEERFKAALKAGMDRYGGKPFAAEKALGMPQDSIRSIFRGDRKAGTSLNRAQELCDAFGLELYIGPPRARPSATGFAEAAQAQLETSLDGSPEALTKGYLPLPFHRADLAHKDLSHLAIARANLDENGLDPDRLSAVVMPNDDMYPAIRPGDLLVIDERHELGPEATLCAFTVGAALRVGWLLRPKGGCLVAFFMRSYTPPVVSKGGNSPVVQCLGQVIIRLDGQPEPWIDREEKTRLLSLAKELVSGR